MAAKEKDELYLVVVRQGIELAELIQDEEGFVLLPSGILTHHGNEVADFGTMETIKWVTSTSSFTIKTNPPKDAIKVKVSIQGTYGPNNFPLLKCTKIKEKNESAGSVSRKVISKKTFKISFRGASTMCPGKNDLLEALKNDKVPQVTFGKQPVTNELELIFKGKVAGKAKLSEETQFIDWDKIGQESVKSIVVDNLKFDVDFEVCEEVKMDFSDILNLAESIGMPTEQAQKRIDIMSKRYHMTKDEIAFIAQSWKKVKPEGLDFIPDIDSVNYVDGPDRTLYYLLGYYADTPDKNLRLVGIQSTGKNTLIEQLASLLWKPLLQLSCSRETSREDFEGAVTLGHTIYKQDKEELEKALIREDFTAFQKASMQAKILELSSENVIQTLEFLKEPLVVGAIEGWWVLLDEINLASSAVTSRFHSLLDYRREITVPKLGTVKATDGFAVIATMNPNSFVGANNMNQAFETRFRTITLDPRDKIADILATQCPNADKDEIDKLDALYNAIFVDVDEEKLPDSFLSVRNFIDALNIKGFAPLKQRVLHNIAYISVNEPDSNKIVADIIDNLF